ncbi:TolC family protein [bacterium]|nr:TolC family protein [bacterium]
MRLLLFVLILTTAASAQELALDYRSVVQLALEGNLPLQMARLRTDQAEARWEVARAQGNPTLTVNGFYVHNDLNLVRSLEPDRKFIPLADSKGLDASDLYVTAQNQMLNRSVLTIPIFTGGRLENQMHRQQHLFEASQGELEIGRRSTALQAKEQYLRWLLADRSLEVAERGRELAAQLDRDTRARFRSGTAQGYDLMQGELAVAGAQDRYKQAETHRDEERLKLARLLHQPQAQGLRFMDRLGSPQLLAEEPPLGGSAQELAQKALNQRPELEQWRRTILANLDEEGVARAGHNPQLLLNLNYDLIGNTLKLRGGFALISSLLIPIYDGGVSASHTQEVQLHRLQLKHEQLAQAEEIVKQVVQALWALEEAESRWLVAHSAMDRAQEALRIAQKRYQVGAGTALELVTQAASLESADYSIALADYARMQARAQLRWAVGGP